MNRDLPPIAEAMKELEREIQRLSEPKDPKQLQAERERNRDRDILIAEAMKELERKIREPPSEAERARAKMSDKIRGNAALIDCIPEVILTLASIAGGTGAEAAKAKVALKPVAEAIGIGFFTDI